MRSGTVLAVFLLFASAASAAQEWAQHEFSASPDQVYQAAVKVIGLHHEIKSKDPENHIVRFHVGTTAWSWGYNMGLSIEKEGENRSTAKVAIEKSGGPALSWGSGKKEVRKIFQWIEDELAKAPKPEPTPKATKPN